MKVLGRRERYSYAMSNEGSKHGSLLQLMLYIDNAVDWKK